VIGAIVKTLRPHQWVKNLFVAAPLVFAKHLADGEFVLRAVVATLAFCALSGAVYAFNDVRDVEADRAHPTKRHRPVASGALSRRAALILAAVLATAALAVTLALGWKVLVFAGAYFVANLLYSLGLKQVAFLDVAFIAGFFLLRVLAGAAAIDVPASRWLLLCTTLLAAFLGLGKRAHELAAAERGGRDAASTRAALAGYRPPLIKAAMIILAFATTGAYVLYTLDDRTVHVFGTRALVWTAPFCALGVARFAFLALGKGGEDSPTESMLRDWLFLANLAAWGLAVLAIVYGSR
jgi:4-hydroxybenzoate polyprenyltransferase